MKRMKLLKREQKDFAMPKITTEDCKSALTAAWPAEFGAGADDWKRVSKQGKKGEPIERVFHHRSLPLQALVTEVDGIISATKISGLAVFDLNDEADDYDDICEKLDSQKCQDFYEKHALFAPSDFYFYVGKTREKVGDEEFSWYSIVPATFFKSKGYMYDQSVGYLIDRFLPEDHGEASSCSYMSEKSPEEIREELLKLGFVEDPGFNKFMDN